MTKEEILKKHWGIIPLINSLNEPDLIYTAMDEYAKHKSVEFFKWYVLRMASFIDYFIKYTDPEFRSERMEQSVKEHEGATIEELYAQFIDNK